MKKISKKKLDELKLRVEAGAAYLAVVHPTKLDLDNMSTCILGQIKGGYYEGKEQLGIESDVRVHGNGEIAQSEAFGFYVDTHEHMPHLTLLWKAKVAQLNRKDKKAKR